MTEENIHPRNVAAPEDMRRLTSLRHVGAEELVPVPFATAGQLRAARTCIDGQSMRHVEEYPDIRT